MGNRPAPEALSLPLSHVISTSIRNAASSLHSWRHATQSPRNLPMYLPSRKTNTGKAMDEM